MSTFGERLAQLRSRRALSQSELAAHLNIAKSTLAMYETDKREPNFETVQKLADFFGVSTAFLISGETTTATTDPAEREFLEWVKDNVESSFFYDFTKSPEEQKREMMKSLRIVWELEKHRKPGQKQGD